MGWETLLGLLNPLNIIKNIWLYFTKPKLQIYYDSRETYHEAFDVILNKLGLFCHVMVANRGKEIAKNCIGQLRRIQVLNNSKFQNIQGYRNIMQLKWAHEKDYSPKDIDEVPKRLDLCYVFKNEDIIHFFTEKYPGGNQTDFAPGTYLVTVRVKCDNAPSTESNFLVNYKAGNFKNLKIDHSS